MERVEESASSPVAAIARRMTAQARKSVALAVAQQTVTIAAHSREKLAILLGVEAPPSLDVRPYCSTQRARRSLTVHGLWNSKTLLGYTIPQLLELRNCGPRSVEEILAGLLIALASPVVQQHLPITDEEIHFPDQRVKKTVAPLTAQGFLTAIRGRRFVK